MSGPDDVVLSEWERERLAAMEGAIAASDPHFTRRLSGARRDLSLWATIALIVAGGVIVLATFTQWPWLAINGLAMMALGMGRAVSRIATRRQQRRARNAGI